MKVARTDRVLLHCCVCLGFNDRSTLGGRKRKRVFPRGLKVAYWSRCGHWVSGLLTLSVTHKGPVDRLLLQYLCVHYTATLQQ